ncbi:MAG: flagellar protein FlaG [Treponema sp.]|nr:flagellar protein FlaG [Candidatus Treponema caballi]
MVSSQGIGQNKTMEGLKPYSDISQQNLSKRISAYAKVPAKTVAPNEAMSDTVDDIIKEKEKIQDTVAQLQNLSDFLDRKVKFNVNEELDRVVIKVIDPSTDKVIKEIPSAEIQEMQVRIKDALGFLFDEKI